MGMNVNEEDMDSERVELDGRGETTDSMSELE